MPVKKKAENVTANQFPIANGEKTMDDGEEKKLKNEKNFKEKKEEKKNAWEHLPTKWQCL